MSELLEVRGGKWPDRFSLPVMNVVLGEDEHGVWVGAAEETPHPLTHDEIAYNEWRYVRCFPRAAWWVATFNPAREVMVRTELKGEVIRRHPSPKGEVYVDITTIPSFEDGVVSAFDLELDVIRRLDGSVVVLDVEEFGSRAYPDEIAVPARAACDDVARMLRDRIEPFGDTGAQWLARFVAGEVQT